MPIAICDIVKATSVKVAWRVDYKLTKKLLVKPEKDKVFSLFLEAHMADKGWFR